MATVKISQLPPPPNGTGSGTPKGTDLVPATDVTDTTSAQSGTTKKYTQSAILNFYLQAQGLVVYSPVTVATTAALTATYSNGASGLGATLTNSGAQAAIAIDGITLSLGNRVLVKNQVSTFENGIYIVSNTGSASTNWVLTRAADYDNASEIIQYGVVFVNQGIVSAGLLYQETAAGPFVIGTSPITFAAYSASSAGSTGVINAGTAQQVAYYATSGNVLSGLTISNNSALIANGSGNLASLAYSTTATASNLVERDSNANIFANNETLNQASNAAGGSVTLTAASARTQIFSGVGASTLILPNATTLATGWTFYVNNNSNGIITVQANDGLTTVLSVPSSQYVQIILTSTGSTNGTWDYHWLIPASMSNGQVMIGGGSSGPKNATLTAGTGVSISNGTNSISISATGTGGGLTWNSVSGTTQAAAVDNGYIIANASQTTVTLPATAPIGSVVAIAGLGAAGWVLAANTGQTIKMAASTTTSAGSLTSAEQYDSIQVVCVVANTTWVVQSAITTGFTIA